jgi:hypothetical protein
MNEAIVGRYSKYTTDELSRIYSLLDEGLSCGEVAVGSGRSRYAIEHLRDIRNRPLSGLWLSIKGRCFNSNNKSYADYGGRGITMFKLWVDNYPEFELWIMENLGPRPDGCSLDRIDNDGNYEPGNLRWADPSTQMANRRHVKSSEIEELRRETRALRAENERLRQLLTATGWSD